MSAIGSIHCSQAAAASTWAELIGTHPINSGPMKCMLVNRSAAPDMYTICPPTRTRRELESGSASRGTTSAPDRANSLSTCSTPPSNSRATRNESGSSKCAPKLPQIRKYLSFRTQRFNSDVLYGPRTNAAALDERFGAEKMVPGAGLEPARPLRGLQILSLMRLPISPPGRGIGVQ